MQIHRNHFKSILPFLFALLTFLMLLIFKNNPALTEQFYSKNFYPVLAGILSQFSSWFPFSLDDVLYVSLSLSCIIGIVLIVLKRLKFKTYALRILQVLALVFCAFYWFWGFNYFRVSVHDRIELKKNIPSTEVFVNVFTRIIKKANDCHVNINEYNQIEVDSILEKSFEKQADFLKISYPTGKRRVKYITFSDFFAKATILGYYGPFFNEVHVNKHLTWLDIPVTTAHEKSHQFGITSEAEASFYGWLVCVKSDNEYVRYSGWMYALDYFLYESRHLENRREFIKMINPEVIEDLKARHIHWMTLRNEKIDDLASKVNDAYLKTNNVEKGVKDYNDVVQLIIDYHELHQSFKN